MRVLNELGAGCPKARQFAVVVVTLTSLMIGITCMIIIFGTINEFPVAFMNSKEVMHAVSKLATFLALTMLLNSVQPVLSGKIFNNLFSYPSC